MRRAKPRLEPRREAPGAARVRGQATIEYLYVLPILLILLFGAMQFTFIYEAKLTLNEAVFTGTRQGALNGGAMASIQDGLEAGLTPLFTKGKDLAALKVGRSTAHDLLGNSSLAKTTIVNPSSGALGFAQAQYDGSNAIPNDNLMYRDPTKMQGGMNIQDANLLKVRVTLCYPLVVPIINRVIYTVVSGLAPTPTLVDTYNGGSIGAPELLKTGINGAATGVCPKPDTLDATTGVTIHNYSIPITSEAVVRMQSPFNTDSVVWTFP